MNKYNVYIRIYTDLSISISSQGVFIFLEWAAMKNEWKKLGHKFVADTRNYAERPRVRVRVRKACPDCAEQDLPGKAQNMIWCMGLCKNHAKKKGLHPKCKSKDKKKKHVERVEHVRQKNSKKFCKLFGCRLFGMQAVCQKKCQKNSEKCLKKSKGTEFDEPEVRVKKERNATKKVKKIEKPNVKKEIVEIVKKAKQNKKSKKFCKVLGSDAVNDLDSDTQKEHDVDEYDEHDGFTTGAKFKKSQTDDTTAWACIETAPPVAELQQVINWPKYVFDHRTEFYFDVLEDGNEDEHEGLEWHQLSPSSQHDYEYVSAQQVYALMKFMFETGGTVNDFKLLDAQHRCSWVSGDENATLEQLENFDPGWMPWRSRGAR